jgi:hypothetical protein
MCFSFKFYTSYFKSPTKAGDAAIITKKKPASLTGAVVELMTNADVYQITFNNTLTPGQKTSVLAAQARFFSSSSLIRRFVNLLFFVVIVVAIVVEKLLKSCSLICFLNACCFDD